MHVLQAQLAQPTTTLRKYSSSCGYKTYDQKRRIYVVLETLFVVGFVAWAIIGPGKVYIIGARLAEAAMDKEGQDRIITVETADGLRFRVTGFGMVDEKDRPLVDIDIMFEPDGDEGFMLTVSEMELLQRVAFIKNCLRSGWEVSEDQLEALVRIAQARAEEIKVTPRRRAKRA
jgi:hypothetical protein